MNTLNQKISQIGVVPVIRLNCPERDALPLAEALIQGGLPVAEVTFRAAGAERAIELMRQRYPDMVVGAGTVLTVDQVERAAAAGANFIVSPGFSAKIVEKALRLNLGVCPGCTTATEYQMALEYGLEMVKFFPAEQAGGLSAIRALAAPFPMLKVMPTGGITLKNLREYLSCPVVAACGGSYMVKAEWIEQRRWDEISKLAGESAVIVSNLRNQ